MNNIGQRIYELRLKNNLSQDTLAEMLGVSRQAISKWENSQSVPEIEKIVMMSEIFGVSTDYIIKGISPENSTCVRSEESERKIHEETSGYTPKKIQQIIGIMFFGTGIIGILLGSVYSNRVMFQLSPLFMIFGLMLTYIKRNAWLWCLGMITVLTIIFGQYSLHPLVYFLLLFIETVSLAVIVVARMKE